MLRPYLQIVVFDLLVAVVVEVRLVQFGDSVCDGRQFGSQLAVSVGMRRNVVGNAFNPARPAGDLLSQIGGTVSAWNITSETVDDGPGDPRRLLSVDFESACEKIWG